MEAIKWNENTIKFERQREKKIFKNVWFMFVVPLLTFHLFLLKFNNIYDHLIRLLEMNSKQFSDRLKPNFGRLVFEWNLTQEKKNRGNFITKANRQNDGITSSWNDKKKRKEKIFFSLFGYLWMFIFMTTAILWE